MMWRCGPRHSVEVSIHSDKGFQGLGKSIRKQLKTTSLCTMTASKFTQEWVRKAMVFYGWKQNKRCGKWRKFVATHCSIRLLRLHNLLKN